MQEVEQELRDQIKDLIRAKKFSELEELWLSIASEPARSLSFHESVLRYLFNRKENDRVAELYTILLNQRNEQGVHQFVLDVSNLILDHDETLTFLRPILITAIKGLYADRPADRVAEFLRLSGLDGDAPNLRKSMERLLDLFGASRGQVFRHTQWGLGVVKEFDAHMGVAVIDFQRKPGHKMTMDGIKQFLRRVPGDHILARIAKDPAALRTEAFEDPAAVIRHALKSFGGKMKAADLKKVLTDNFMDDAEYRRWWNKAKDECRTDPYIDQQGIGANMLLILRSEPRSFVDEIFERFLTAKTLGERRNVLRDVARHGDNADMTEKDIDSLFQLFCKPLNDGSLKTPADQFGHGVLFEEYAHLFKDDVKNPIDIPKVLADPQARPGELVVSLEVFELQRIALQHVINLREQEAEDVCTEVFFEADPRLVEWMEKALESKGRQGVLDHCVERVLAHPDRNIDLFVWAGRKVIEGKLPHVAESVRPVAVCQSASTLLSDAEETIREVGVSEADKTAATQVAARMRVILQDSHGKLLKSALRQATVDEARKFLAHIKMLGSLSNQLREMIEESILLEHPGLRRRTREEEAETETQKTHYAAPDSIDRKRLELSQILNVEIPENSKAIGAARELGDLRENAEYHAAKDRQKVLMARARELEDLISRARPVELDKVKTDQVRFGTRVTLRRIDDGGEESHILMGMWEANADQGILSYLTPFGSQLMGRRPDEQFEVTLPDGRKLNYRVAQIEKAGSVAGG